jgi:hypothetical protein
MVMPYHLEHRWSRVGAVYASDVCQFRDKEWEKVQIEESVKEVVNWEFSLTYKTTSNYIAMWPNGL